MLGLRHLRPLLLALVTLAAGADAAQIDLRLDVQYTDAQPSAGGSWTLYARTDEQGLFSLQAPLVGVAATINNELPRGRVNGAVIDNAGFATLFSQASPGGRTLFAGQVVAPSGQEQGVFYGVGTLTSGSPNFPGQPGGTNSLGPSIPSLTALLDSPWATSDPVWSTGVTVASGIFSAGATPGFGDQASDFAGSLLTTIGDLDTPGLRTLDVAFTTEVVTNLAFGTATGDYNADGLVDAADYTIWRDTQGQSVTPLTGADGDGNGQIETNDRIVWAANYGSTPASAAALAVPEPGAAITLGTALLALFSAPRRLGQLAPAEGKRRQPRLGCLTGCRGLNIFEKAMA